MTNAEAIETLRANYPDACYEQLREAVDAAIEALNAPYATGDTIGRQAAINALKNLPCYGLIDAYDRVRGVGVRLKFAEAALNNLPAADPVKHGKWELVDEAEPRRYGCSECKRLSYTQDNYCSYCGARMCADDDWEEPEINPCRGCKDYDGRGGCKSHGGCGAERSEE